MIVLGIDGALGGFSASLAADGEVTANVSIGANLALESGLGAVSEVLTQAKVTPTRLTRLAAGIGPGGFTGLRIALAYAKSLAQAWRLPLVGVSSFDVLEFGVDLERLLTVVVGRPGVISARYRDGVTARRASGPVAEVLRAILPTADENPLPTIGAPEDVVDALAEARFIVDARTPLVVPAAAAVALIGARAEPAHSSHAIVANYGEAPAAKVPSRERRRPVR